MRKPTKILQIQGTAQKCRLEKRRGELEVGGGFPEPPDWLEGRGLAEWYRVRAISDYAVCITEADTAVLAGYCKLYGELADNGDLSATKWQTFISLASRLGMSPADRSKVIVGNKKPENKFAKFAKRA